MEVWSHRDSGGLQEGAEEEGWTRPYTPLLVHRPDGRRKWGSCLPILRGILYIQPLSPNCVFPELGKLGRGRAPAHVQVNRQAHPGDGGRAAGLGAPDTAGPSLVPCSPIGDEPPLGTAVKRTGTPRCCFPRSPPGDSLVPAPPPASTLWNHSPKSASLGNQCPLFFFFFFASKQPRKMIIKYSCNSTNRGLLNHLKEENLGLHPASLIPYGFLELNDKSPLASRDARREAAWLGRKAGKQPSCREGFPGKHFEGRRCWGGVGGTSSETMN